jgi:hypothetical protein
MSSNTERLIALLAAGLLVGFSMVEADDESDPVLEYYWQHARQTARVTNPDTAGVSYSFRTKTYKRTVGDAGRISRTDSVLQDYFFTNGSLDSVKTVQGEGGRFKNLDFSHPDVFESDYHLNLFPNDTGGPRFAIGLWSDTTMGSQPDGLVVIDRNQYFLYALYSYYPEKGGYKRFTRSFRFVMVDGYVFPDSVWEVATKLGVFFPESYRLETGISEIKVWKNREPGER